MELRELIGKIPPPDEAAGRKARRRWDSLAKPLGALGALEEAVVRMAALRGGEPPALHRRALLVFCADHGVVSQGVSQCGAEVTAAVGRALAAGESTVCHMARAARCAVQPVDMGMLDFPGCKGMLSCRIRNGSGDISLGPAMEREQCISAIRAGAGLAMVQEADILAIGEMGIGNTTAAAALASVLLDLPPEAVVGRGAGLSDEGLRRKRAVVARAIAVNRPDPSDPVELLMKLGGLELAAMCGAFLGAALSRRPALIDGAVSAAAALCAVRLCPNAAAALLASHCSAEPMAGPLLRALGLRPLVAAGISLGEGGGAVAALPLLDLALAVYHKGRSFAELGIAPYRPQGGERC